jgi:heme exporter protein CcmD
VIEYLDMGGRGWYVWPSFAISAAALGLLVYASVRRLRTAETQVKALEAREP